MPIEKKVDAILDGVSINELFKERPKYSLKEKVIINSDGLTIEQAKELVCQIMRVKYGDKLEG